MRLANAAAAPFPVTDAKDGQQQTSDTGIAHGFDLVAAIGNLWQLSGFQHRHSRQRPSFDLASFQRSPQAVGKPRLAVDGAAQHFEPCAVVFTRSFDLGFKLS